MLWVWHSAGHSRRGCESLWCSNDAARHTCSTSIASAVCSDSRCMVVAVGRTVPAMSMLLLSAPRFGRISYKLQLQIILVCSVQLTFLHATVVYPYFIWSRIFRSPSPVRRILSSAAQLYTRKLNLERSAVSDYLWTSLSNTFCMVCIYSNSISVCALFPRYYHT